MILGPDGQPVSSQPRSSFGFGQAFEAAKRTGFKGYFWFPDLDAAAQLDPWTRQTIDEKINWLYNNVGPIRSVVDGLSLDEAETGIWPKATSSNRHFNKSATDRFHESWKDRRFFDTRKVETVYSAQFAMRRHIRLHGELFGMFVRPDASNPFVRIHFIPRWQIRNTGKEKAGEGWVDGVRSDRWGAAELYRVVTKADDSEWMDVPAEDMLHFHDHFWIGQTRGVSGLAPVARKLFTMDDVEKAMANGIQLRTMMAYAIERSDGDNGGPTLLPMTGDSEIEEVETPGGGKLFVQKIISKDGQEVTVAEPPAGRKIKVLESNASQEPLGFKRDVLTDTAYCTLYPPDYVFAVATGAIGTEIRWKVRRVETVKRVVRQFQIIPQFLEPAYRFRTWNDIKRGVHDKVQDGIPADWFKANMISPADTSVDRGREGKLLDERVATGKMGWNRYFGIEGEDRLDVDLENLAVREEREELLDEVNAARKAKGKEALKYEDIWPANSNVAAANAAQNNEPDSNTAGGIRP